jgi:hypothetical protein
MQAHPRISQRPCDILLSTPRFGHRLSGNARNMANLRAEQIKSSNM